MIFNAAAQALFAAGHFAPRWLLYVTSKARDTGASVPFGIWDGDDHQTFVVDGESRLYYGAQSAFSVGQIVYGTGLQVRTVSVSLSGVGAEGEQLVRGYDVRLAPAELHCAVLDPLSGSVADVKRAFVGTVNGASITTPAEGGQTMLELSLTSSLRSLTQTLAIKKSDQSQRLRGGDRGRRYSSLADRNNDPWGTDD